MREVGKAQLACFWGTGVRTMGISFAAVQKTAHTNNLLAVLKTESVAHPKSNTNKCLLISYVLLAKKPIIPFQNMPKNSKTLIFFGSPSDNNTIFPSLFTILILSSPYHRLPLQQTTTLALGFPFASVQKSSFLSRNGCCWAQEFHRSGL